MAYGGAPSPYGMVGTGGTSAFPWGPVGIGASIGGGLLAGLFGSKKKPPGSGDLARMFGTGALSQDTLNLYRMLAGSPMFQQALSQNALAGARVGGGVQSALTQHGITGAGLIGSILGQNAGAFGASALRGGLFGTAGNLAQENLLARLQAYTSLQGQMLNQPNFLQSLSGALLGAGGSALLR